MLKNRVVWNAVVQDPCVCLWNLLLVGTRRLRHVVDD